MLKLAAVAACLALPAPVAAAQSFTILLNRAIYLEATAGDVDGAVRIYRQILAGGADARVYRADAQYRLSMCLMKKGEKAGAGRHFQDPTVGYSFTLPEGWTAWTRAPYNGGPGDCTELQDPENKAVATICAKPDRTASGAIDQKLLKRETEMLDGRTSTYPAYVLRPGSSALGTLNGRRTITIFADYARGARNMTEWTTWVESESTRASVIVDAAAADLPEFQTRFTPILNSLRIP